MPNFSHGGTHALAFVIGFFLGMMFLTGLVQGPFKYSNRLYLRGVEDGKPIGMVECKLKPGECDARFKLYQAQLELDKAAKP